MQARGLVLLGLTLLGCGDDTAANGGDDGHEGSSSGAVVPTSTGAAEATGETSSSSGNGTSSTSGSSSSSEDTTGDMTGDTTGAVELECVYPLQWPVDPAARTAAEATLNMLAPEAAMVWSDARGTFSSVGDLDLVIDCPDDSSLLGAVFAFFEQHPALFPVEADEWFTDTGTLCQNVTSPTPGTFNTSRHRLGNWGVSRDVIAPRLYRDESDNVVLRSVNGTFVPPLSPSVTQQVSDCIDKSPSARLLEQTIRTEPFEYLIYGGPVFCGPTSAATYVADDADDVSFDDDAQLSWSDTDSDHTIVTIAQRVELRVAAANVTEDIQASNAACPAPDGVGTIYGFSAYLDLVTAEVSNKLAGLGCIVC